MEDGPTVRLFIDRQVPEDLWDLAIHPPPPTRLRCSFSMVTLVLELDTLVHKKTYWVEKEA